MNRVKGRDRRPPRLNRRRQPAAVPPFPRRSSGKPRPYFGPVFGRAGPELAVVRLTRAPAPTILSPATVCVVVCLSRVLSRIPVEVEPATSRFASALRPFDEMVKRDPVFIFPFLAEIESSVHAVIYGNVPVVLGDLGRRSCSRSPRFHRRRSLFGVWPCCGSRPAAGRSADEWRSEWTTW